MTVTSSFVTHSVFSTRGVCKFCICVSCLQSPYILAVCHVESVVSHVFTDDCNNHVLQCERDAFPWHYWPKRKHCIRLSVSRCHHHRHTLPPPFAYLHHYLPSPSPPLFTIAPLPTPNVVLAHASTSDWTFLENSRR